MKPGLLAGFALGCAALLLFQAGTYLLIGAGARADILVALLPSTSRCPNICCSDQLLWPFEQSRRHSLERELHSRYRTVYRTAEDIPWSAWVYECQADVCKEVEVKDVCMFTWEAGRSGPFWMSASYRNWSGPGVAAGIDGKYVWGLYRWFEIDAQPRVRL